MIIFGDLEINRSISKLPLFFFSVANLEHANTSDKATQNDYISMLKECDIFRYQQQHPDQFRPFTGMLAFPCSAYFFEELFPIDQVVSP